MPPSAQQSHLEYAYNALKERILDLTVQPGDVLNISRLAADLGVSRTPVREALGMLVRDGLVTSLPDGGFRVATVTLRDVREAFSVQAHLEALAVELAAPRMTAERLKALRHPLNLAETALGHGEKALMNRHGMDFHARLVEASDNRILIAIHRNLLERLMYLSIIGYLSPTRPPASHQEHLNILQALEEGDVPKTQSLVRYHLVQAIENLVTLVSEQGGEPIVFRWPGTNAP